MVQTTRRVTHVPLPYQSSLLISTGAHPPTQSKYWQNGQQHVRAALASQRWFPHQDPCWTSRSACRAPELLSHANAPNVLACPSLRFLLPIMIPSQSSRNKGPTFRSCSECRWLNNGTTRWPTNPTRRRHTHPVFHRNDKKTSGGHFFNGPMRYGPICDF